MSTTKKIMSAIAAIVLMMSVAMISFAFKSDTNTNKPTASKWYSYNGGSVSSLTSYVLISPQPVIDENFCPGSTALCAILAPEGTGINPSDLTGIQAEITAALISGDETDNVQLKF